MKNHFQILIIGGGNAGIALAAQLHRKDGKLDIAIVEPSKKHHYQPAWTLVGGGVYGHASTERSEASVMPPKVEWIHDAAASFEPENNTLVTASGKRCTYDFLVVAPGIQLDWEKIKGLRGNLGKYGITSNYSFETAPYTFELISNLKKGKALFTNPNTPIKCGGAPQKAMYMSSDYWRKHGVLSDVQVHFYSAASMIFGIKEYRETLEGVIKRYGIHTHYFHNLVEIKAQEKVAVFDVYKDGQVVDQLQDTYDMIHITPPQSAPDFIKNSPLAVPGNPLGWVDVDKFTFQHVRYANIYSLGDVSSTPNAKTGAAVRKQVPVLVEQLVSQIYHKKASPAQYHGYGSCPLVTGYGKLVMAEFDYDNKRVETFPFDQSKERLSMYLLKTQVLPRLYWNAILKGLM